MEERRRQSWGLIKAKEGRQKRGFVTSRKERERKEDKYYKKGLNTWLRKRESKGTGFGSSERRKEEEG